MSNEKKNPTKHAADKVGKRKPSKNVIKPDQDIVAAGAEDLKMKLLKMVQTGLKELTIDLADVQRLNLHVRSPFSTFSVSLLALPD